MRSIIRKFPKPKAKVECMTQLRVVVNRLGVHFTTYEPRSFNIRRILQSTWPVQVAGLVIGDCQRNPHHVPPPRHFAPSSRDKTNSDSVTRKRSDTKRSTSTEVLRKAATGHVLHSRGTSEARGSLAHNAPKWSAPANKIAASRNGDVSPKRPRPDWIVPWRKSFV